MSPRRVLQWSLVAAFSVFFSAFAGGVMANELAEGTESGVRYETVDWSQFFVEPQPDQDEYWETKAGEPEWSGFHYYNATGSVFRPRDGDHGWDYSGGGCVETTSTIAFLTLHLDIPDGARIDYLRLFYYDNSASSSVSFISNYDGSGGVDDLTSVASDGDTGYGTTLSTFVDHVVDSASRGYVVQWSPGEVGGNQQLCGVRVAYRLPD